MTDYSKDDRVPNDFDQKSFLAVWEPKNQFLSFFGLNCSKTKMALKRSILKQETCPLGQILLRHNGKDFPKKFLKI